MASKPLEVFFVAAAAAAMISGRGARLGDGAGLGFGCDRHRLGPRFPPRESAQKAQYARECDWIIREYGAVCGTVV
jgi:hypothetical protein